MATQVGQTTAINTPSIKTDTAALAAAEGRTAWTIQNVGTNPPFVRLGGDASATVYHYVLKGGSADNDGLGALVGETAGTVYTGLITVFGTSPKYVVMEH